MNKIEETFRNPNLPIETFREMQQKHEESLKEIQSKFFKRNESRLSPFKGNKWIQTEFIFIQLKIHEFN